MTQTKAACQSGEFHIYHFVWWYFPAGLTYIYYNTHLGPIDPAQWRVYQAWSKHLYTYRQCQWRLSCSFSQSVQGLASHSSLCISSPRKAVQRLDLFRVFCEGWIKLLLVKCREISSSYPGAQIWPDTICSLQRSKVDSASMNYTLSDMWCVRANSCM